ncbi:MAG: hypothetical protein H8E21_13550 [Gammaproteobacteria bacterium]|nr:hypothetical protein [Gammaproteobacteria bacterium]MBL6998791.1 hypothetical protein [Gammaproteobacteria bacterium]
MDKITFKQSLLAFSIATVLTACGGGSDSPSSTTGGDPGVSGVQMSGTAAKGIIIGGIVVASEIDSAGIALREVGRATTGNDGSYSLSLGSNYQGGPIIIEVTRDADTRMVCDAVAGCGTRPLISDGITDNSNPLTVEFGEEFKPSQLFMKAILAEATNGETLEVQITPYTHMAAERALNNPSSDLNAIKTAINNANSAVSQLLGGIDILRTKPVDITKSVSISAATPTAIAYAAMNAAIAQLALIVNGEPDIEAALLTLAGNFKTAGSLDATDDIGDDNKIALQEIINKAEDSLTKTGSIDTSGTLNDLKTVVTTAVSSSGGVVTPTASTSAGDSDVKKAKAFLADLRTWGVTLDSQLSTPVSAFQTQIDLADRAAALIQNDRTGEAVGLGALAIESFFLGQITSLTEFVDTTTATNPFTAGTITQATVNGVAEYRISGAKVNSGVQTIDLDMVLTVPADGAAGTVITLGVKSIVAESNAVKFMANAGTIELTLAESYTIDYAMLDLGTAAQPSAPTKLVLDLNVSLTQKTTLTSLQAVSSTVAADPITFAAALGLTIYPYTDPNGEIIDLLPGSFSASGTVSNTTGDSLDVSLSASLTDAATLQPLNPTLALDSSYADNNAGGHLISWAYTDNGNTFTYQNPNENYLVSYNPVDFSVSYDNTTIFGAAAGIDPGPYSSLIDFASQTAGGFFPNDFTFNIWVDGQGEYVRQFGFTDYSMDGHVVFLLDDVDVEFFNQTRPAKGSAGIQFAAQFDGLPPAKVSVSGNVTGFEQGNAIVSIAYGTRKLEFKASNDNASPNVEAGSLEITNQDGVKMLLTAQLLNDGIQHNEKVDITLNGKSIATVEETSNGSTRVKYIDGTIEIF